ncbi:MAG: GWxTD domain-containing protein [Bacteroidetes bacterium]|nr:GWxTD domain-containing protein [Bacteroidota bacterium]
MKKYLIILFLSFVAFTNGLIASNITAYLTYATFNTMTKGPYLETYLSVIGNSMVFVKNKNGMFQGAVDISVVFSQKGEIKNAQKYSLSSPEIADTSKGRPNFIDQQRYVLANGTYDLELTIVDKNKPVDKPFVTTFPVAIDFQDSLVGISSIQLLESYSKSVTPGILTKSGYDLVPYVSTYFPENISRIKFYTEIYHTKKTIGEGEKLLVSYYIESFENKTRLNDYSGFNKQVSNDVNILLSEFNIESLPTGNYNLVVEVRDKENKILAKQSCFIQRTNKLVALNFDDIKALTVSNTFVSTYKNIDSLNYYIKSLRPISSTSEVQFSENQIGNKELELKQQYFYNFWKSRNALNPELAWLLYYKEVMKVNKEFSSYGLKGFDTDRGRVYLQYGPPDQRTKYDTEPSALPYEIWEYYSLVDKTLELSNPDNRQSNKKFVFYNPDLVTNKYVLIHSEARGEINNTRWKLLIYKRDTQSTNLDDESAPSHYGGNADDNFKNPR